MSIPTSAIALTTSWLSSDPGSDPPDHAMARPAARWLNQPSAIWERPALCTQRKSTAGTHFCVWSRMWARASRRCEAYVSAVTVSPTITALAGSASSSVRTSSKVSPVEWSRCNPSAGPSAAATTTPSMGAASRNGRGPHYERVLGEVVLDSCLINDVEPAPRDVDLGGPCV